MPKSRLGSRPDYVSLLSCQTTLTRNCASVLAEAMNRNLAAAEEHSGESSREQSHAGFIALIARWRWFWIPPLYALAMIFLLIVTLTRGASTAQFMYGNF